MYSISRGRPVPKTWDGEKEVKKNLTPFLYASCHFFKKICHISREILRGHREVLFFGSTLLKTSLFDGGRVGNRSSALAKPPTSYKQHRASRLQCAAVVSVLQCTTAGHGCAFLKRRHTTHKNTAPQLVRTTFGGTTGTYSPPGLRRLRGWAPPTHQNGGGHRISGIPVHPRRRA